MRNMYKINVLTAVFAMAVNASVPQIVLQLRDNAMVNDTVITIGAIADIIQCPQGIKNQLVNTVIGDAAPAGFNRFVSIDDLMNYKLRDYNIKFGVELHGSSRIRVTTDSQLFEIKNITTEIKTYIRQFVKWPENDLEITVLDIMKNCRILKKTYHVDFESSKDPYCKDNLAVRVIIQQGTIRKIIPVVCDLKVTTEVVVAQQNIPAKSRIVTDQVTLERRDITHYCYTPVTSASKINKLIARRTITAGTIIHLGMVEKEPDIVKGQMVLIRLNRGKIALSVEGTARESGYNGEDIWVESSYDNKLLKSRIEKKGQVVVN